METKKKMILTIIGIVTLLVLIGSATYAYFTVGTNYEDFMTNINAKTDGTGSVAIKSGTNLNLNLTLSDMRLLDSDVVYYATEDGTASTEVNNVAVATTEVTGTGTYSCNYTLNVAYTGTMKAAIPNEGSVILNVNGTDYDIYSTDFPITISGTLTELRPGLSQTINGYLKVINLSGIDQTAMAGTIMGLSFTATEFDCTAIEDQYNCKTYDENSPGECIECYDGFTPDGHGTCIACHSEFANCQTCSTTSNECLMCEDGYVLENGECM